MNSEYSIDIHDIYIQLLSTIQMLLLEQNRKYTSTSFGKIFAAQECVPF